MNWLKRPLGRSSFMVGDLWVPFFILALIARVSALDAPDHFWASFGVHILAMAASWATTALLVSAVAIPLAWFVVRIRQRQGDRNADTDLE